MEQIGIPVTAPIEPKRRSAFAELFPMRVTNLYLAFVYCVLIPSALNVLISKVQTPEKHMLVSIPESAFHLCAFILIVSAGILLIEVSPLRIMEYVVSLVITLYYISVYFLIAHVLYTGDTFDFFFFADSYQEIVSTGIGVFGIAGFSGILIGFFFGGLILYRTFLGIWTRFDYIFKKIRWLIIFFLAIGIVGTAFVPPPDTFVGSGLVDTAQAMESRDTVEPFLPDNSSFKTKSKDNVFILQLESINSLAVQGHLEIDGKKYKKWYTPFLSSIAGEGIIIPMFWANSIQTNRAQATFFCGVVQNIEKAFSYRLDDLSSICLPKLLSDSGYSTAYYRSDSLKYANMGKFAKKVGFDEIHNSDIMKKDDTEHKWGYDDCIFYERAFDDLEKSYSKDREGIFAFFEVSNHHSPWKSYDEYKSLHPFPKPNNYMEKYLNSVIQQDYCAFKFYERYKKFSPENSHLVILSDTSQPVGFHGSVHLKKHTFNENYLTPFVYIPPRKESDKFRIGEIIYELSYAQSDLVATIFDLLNGKAKQNSFAFALRKSTDRGLFAKLGMKPAAPSYENCHVLSQPYGGGEIGVVRNDDKYVYFVKKKKVTHYNIKDDLLEQNPKVISEDLSYEDFYNNYYCERFKY